MTVAAMETNLDGFQKAEMAIRTIDKGDDKKKMLRRMSNEEVMFFVYNDIRNGKEFSDLIIIQRYF
jgi:phosphoenolpyruvate-protein kinase (PTS system EI component)